jgi:multiple sugar transport system permease protein
MRTAIPARPVTPVSPTIWQRFHRMGEARFGLLLLLPTIVILLVFLLFPIGYAMMMSFQQIELTMSSDRSWVGLENYVGLLGERAVRDSVSRTLIFSLMTIVITTVLSLVLALLLNEPFRGRGFVRVLILLPWAVAPVVNGVMWRYLFHSNYGLVNALLYQWGFIDRYRVWMDNAQFALTVAAFGTAWKGMPFATLIILAALQSIPESLYRAAKMDGAGIIARFRYVTLPHLRNILIFVVLLQTIVSLQVFDLIFTLTRGGPGQGTVVLSFLVFLNAFERLSLGKASAMAVMLAMLIMVLSAASLSFMIGRRRR